MQLYLSVLYYPYCFTWIALEQPAVSKQATMNVLMKIISVLLVTGGAFASATKKPSLHSRVEKVLRNLRVHNRPRHLLNAQKIHQSPRTQVDYGALYHPFDERRRKLQTDGTDYDTTQGYQPLRIKFLTEPLDDLRPSLDAVNQARVDAIKDRVRTCTCNTVVYYVSVLMCLFSILLTCIILTLMFIYTIILK